jgi:nucleoside-diphosphate-sugar epimerase
MTPKLLVTGADGFIGAALVERLRRCGHEVLAVTRESTVPGSVAVGDLSEFNAWPTLLRDVSGVVHLAARAHVLEERDPDATRAYEVNNVTVTQRLARAAALCGVRRFVFLSSIGVHGNQTHGRPFRGDDTPNPVELYARSKWRAEQALEEMARNACIEVVRVRPPLVIGPGAKGNLSRLLGLVDLGIPLPFGSIDNRRSFVSIDELCDLLLICLVHQRAPDRVWLAANPREISTPDLLRAMAQGLGRRLWLPKVPADWLMAMAGMAGQGEAIRRLTSSLTIDAAATHEQLGWVCTRDLLEEVRRMARAHASGKEGTSPRTRST